MYFTSPLFVLDEFYCTSSCFKSLFIVSLCVFVQQNERTYCFYEWVCVMQWYLLIQTSARAGSMATTPAVPLVLCKGTVMCCLETTLLIKTLSTSCSSLGNEKELLFYPASSFFPPFSSALQTFLVGIFLSSRRLSSSHSPKQALMSNIFIHFPCIYIR